MRRATLLLGFGCCGLGLVSIYFWQELGRERTRNTELNAQLARQSVELERITAGAANAVQEAAPVPVPATPAVPANSSLAAVPATPKPVVDSSQDWDARQRTLMRDPKYREARREQERLKLAQRRANLIRLLGFSPEQADATIDLDIDQQFRWDEEYAARRSSEETRQDVVRARADAIEREHQDKLRALLGEEKSLRLQAYMESRQSRMQVDNLRSELNEANALRDDQVEPLIAALHVERAQMKSELKEYRDTLIWDGDNTEHWQRYSERSIELMKAMNSRMLTSASSLLTQAQLDALEKNLREDLAQAEAQQRMNRIQSKLDLANQSTATPN